MQRLEVSGVVRLIYRSLGVKGLTEESAQRSRYSDQASCSRLQLKSDGTRWRTGEEVKGNCRMEWVASTLHTTSEHGVSSITTADAHTSAASSRLNWRPRRFKWARPFRRKTKSGFCACAIIFQLASTTKVLHFDFWQMPDIFLSPVFRLTLRRISL